MFFVSFVVLLRFFHVPVPENAVQLVIYGEDDTVLLRGCPFPRILFPFPRDDAAYNIPQ